MSKLKRLLCYESQHQSQSNEKSLVQFDYEKAVSNYLGTQSTFRLNKVGLTRAHCRTACSASDSAWWVIGLLTILPSLILYGVWHTKEGSVGGRILRNGRAIVMQ